MGMNQSTTKMVQENPGAWRSEYAAEPRGSEAAAPPSVAVVSEEVRKMRLENAANISELDRQIQEQKDKVKHLEEQNSQKRAPCNSETVQRFREDMKALQDASHQDAERMRVASAQLLVNHIVEKQDEAQIAVDKLRALEDSQEESRRELRQAELAFSREFDEDGHIVAICDGGNPGTPTARPLYKVISQEVSILPKSLNLIRTSVTLAVKNKKPSFAKGKKEDAELVFNRIDRSIITITQKGTEILQTLGHDKVGQDLLTAFARIRDEFKKILDAILEMKKLWEEDSENEAEWLRNVAREMEKLDGSIKVVTDLWKTVKIPEN